MPEMVPPAVTPVLPSPMRARLTRETGADIVPIDWQRCRVLEECPAPDFLAGLGNALSG